MGGDDLDDDDQLLWIQPVRDSSALEEDDDADDQKLKRPLVDNKNDDHHVNNEIDTRKKVKKETFSSGSLLSTTQLLLKVGRTIDQQTNMEQAQFLTTAIRHYTLIQSSGSTSDKNMTTDDNNGAETNGAEIEANDDLKEQQALITILPQHCLGSDHLSIARPVGRIVQEPDSPSSSVWLDRIRQVVSLKTLREWKHIGSPCVVRYSHSGCLHCSYHKLYMCEPTFLLFFFLSLSIRLSFVYQLVVRFRY
jgi:hypothetical protein